MWNRSEVRGQRPEVGEEEGKRGRGEVNIEHPTLNIEVGGI
jgi:hypothetical protein